MRLGWSRSPQTPVGEAAVTLPAHLWGGHAVVTPAASVSHWPQGPPCVPGTQSPGSSGVYGYTGAGQMETPSPRYEEVHT